jgi:thiol-disulfide isomerase/thioredoxin
MRFRPNALFAVFVLSAFALAYASTPSESSITDGLKGLRGLSEDKRPAATLKLAEDIRTLPAGPGKVRLATGLAGLSTEGDAGHDTLQAVADTLSKALAESPVPAKGDRPPAPYDELANLVRYEGLTTTLDDPLYAKAMQILVDNDADVAKADFTLKDLHGKKVTLSELRGKIVMVNFWATWCPVCRAEMPDWQKFYEANKARGFEMIAMSVDDGEDEVRAFMAKMKYRFPVGWRFDKVEDDDFPTVRGTPTTYFVDRQGKVALKKVGPVSGELLSQTVEKLLAQ